MKKFLVIFGGAVIVVVISSYLWSENKEQIVEPDIELISQKLISDQIIDKEDVDDEPPVIIGRIIDTTTTMVVRFVEIPEWSGTGGNRAIIVSSNFSGQNLMVLGDFFGSKERLQQTLKTSEGIVYYTEQYTTSSCSFTSQDVEINLNDKNLSQKKSPIEFNNCSDQ